MQMGGSRNFLDGGGSPHPHPHIGQPYPPNLYAIIYERPLNLKILEVTVLFVGWWVGVYKGMCILNPTTVEVEVDVVLLLN